MPPLYRGMAKLADARDLELFSNYQARAALANFTKNLSELIRAGSSPATPTTIAALV